MEKIEFCSEQTDFVYRGKMLTRRWIAETVADENHQLGAVTFIFCSDAYLLEINRQYLGHDYFTDVITFDYDHDDTVSGDIFISIDTVRANASEFGVGFDEELHRVVIHGVLHLLGYDDKSDEAVKVMRSKENHYLKTLAAMTDDQQK